MDVNDDFMNTNILVQKKNDFKLNELNHGAH